MKTGQWTSSRESVFDVEGIRMDFPILRQKTRGKPLVYLDNGATTQKPDRVIDCVAEYYRQDNANIHRGVYELSDRATQGYERARESVRRFINARSTNEIVFTRGTTESINLVCRSWGRSNLEREDEIVITWMEHHSNIVPWQMLCEEIGAVLRVVPMDQRGNLQMERYEALLGPRTRLVAVCHVSNALGTVNPVDRIVELAHAREIPVLLDGAQAVPHMAVDVRALDCDFYAFSGHKMFGPTGIGILYGKEHLLEAMPPYQGGGDMIRMVTFERTLYNDLPYKFEAGTPNIAGAIGLGATVGYLEEIGMERVAAYEQELLDHATGALQQVPGLRLIGTAEKKAGVLSFVLDDIHPHDIGTILDQDGIAIRTGHHCAMPVMEHFQVPATARASLAFYNTRREIDALVAGLHRVIEVFH